MNKKLMLIVAIAFVCSAVTTQALFRDRYYDDRPGLVRGTGEAAVDVTEGAVDTALTVGTLGGWRPRNRYRYNDANWRNRRNYSRGYYRESTSAYPAGNAIGNREYYPTDGYTR